MPVQIDMDMPDNFIYCCFYSHNSPINGKCYCKADLSYHVIKDYGLRCDNCPLKEVK